MKSGQNYHISIISSKILMAQGTQIDVVAEDDGESGFRSPGKVIRVWTNTPPQHRHTG